MSDMSRVAHLLAEADGHLAEISCRRDDVFAMAAARKLLRSAYDELLAAEETVNNLDQRGK